MKEFGPWRNVHSPIVAPMIWRSWSRTSSARSTGFVPQLKKWKAKTDGACPLLFPTSGGRPRLNFLDRCKAVAERAKLNEDDFWLHKFRATFATRALWAGVDLRTVQSWMGHTDLESTMRYLKAEPRRGRAREGQRDVRLRLCTAQVAQHIITSLPFSRVHAIPPAARSFDRSGTNNRKGTPYTRSCPLVQLLIWMVGARQSLAVEDKLLDFPHEGILSPR
jgi:hypothetical protein